MGIADTASKFLALITPAAKPPAQNLVVRETVERGPVERGMYVAGEFVPGSRHYLIEEQQQRNRPWLHQSAAWERMFGAGR